MVWTPRGQVWLAVGASLSAAACRPAAEPSAPEVALARAEVQREEQASSLEALIEQASSADFVCVGEQHDDPAHHRFQHAMLRLLIARRDRPLALGLEMFQRPAQPALDDYARGGIDEAELRRVSRWDERWGFDYAMYQPLLEDAHDYGVRLLALNAPRALTKAVVRRGLEGLDDDERAALPRDLDLDDEAHRRFFWAAMGFDEASGSHHGADPERFYAAQVVWDESMAETAASWIERGGQVMAVAGNGHCHDHAIARRVQRRISEAETVTVLLRTGEGTLPAQVTSDFIVTLPPS